MEVREFELHIAVNEHGDWGWSEDKDDAVNDIVERGGETTTAINIALLKISMPLPAPAQVQPVAVTVGEFERVEVPPAAVEAVNPSEA